MGYDFSFLRLTPRPTTFPLHPEVGGPWDVKDLRSPAAVEKFLVESRGFRPNHVGLRRSYRYEVPGEGGSLYVRVSAKSVHVDVHAHWSEITKLYRSLLPLEDDLLIADHQTGDFYDAVAFDAFIEESYRRKAGHE